MNEQTKNWIWIILVVFMLYKCSGSDHKDHSSSSLQYENSSSSITHNYGDKENNEELTGDFDCTVTNLTSGNGPYSLECEHDGEDTIIHFPNGGSITVDENGFHGDTGDTWEIEK